MFLGGGDFTIPETNSLFWGLAPGNRPSQSWCDLFWRLHASYEFFGDCSKGGVNREVFKDCNHPQNGNATHAVTLVLDLNLFEPPSSSHWGVAIDTVFFQG